MPSIGKTLSNNGGAMKSYMFTLDRLPGETIILDNDITLTILGITTDSANRPQVRVEIITPPHISVGSYEKGYRAAIPVQQSDQLGH